MKCIISLLLFWIITINAFGQLVRVPNRSAKKYIKGNQVNSAEVIKKANKTLFKEYDNKITKTNSKKRKSKSVKNDWQHWKYHDVAAQIRLIAKDNDINNKNALWTKYNDSTSDKAKADSIFDAIDSVNMAAKKAAFLLAYDEWTNLHDFQFYPARNNYLAQAYFGEYGDNVVQSLKNGFLNFTPYGGLIYSELVSGYAGPLRVSFGGMIASSNLSQIDSTTIKNTASDKLDSLFKANDSVNRVKSSIQNLLGGGGNAMLVLSTPLFNYHPGNIFNLNAAWFDKTCFTIPSLGNEITDYSIVNGLGLQMDMRFLFESPSVSTFGIYCSGTGTILMGNKSFYTNLGTNPAKILAFGQVTFGLILERFKIYYTYNVINDKSLQTQMPNCIGVNLTPF